MFSVVVPLGFKHLERQPFNFADVRQQQFCLEFMRLRRGGLTLQEMVISVHGYQRMLLD